MRASRSPCPRARAKGACTADARCAWGGRGRGRPYCYLSRAAPVEVVVDPAGVPLPPAAIVLPVVRRNSDPVKVVTARMIAQSLEMGLYGALTSQSDIGEYWDWEGRPGILPWFDFIMADAADDMCQPERMRQINIRLTGPAEGPLYSPSSPWNYVNVAPSLDARAAAQDLARILIPVLIACAEGGSGRLVLLFNMDFVSRDAAQRGGHSNLLFFDLPHRVFMCYEPHGTGRAVNRYAEPRELLLHELGEIIHVKYIPLPEDLCPVGTQIVEAWYRKSPEAIYDNFPDLEPGGYCQLFTTLVFHKLVASRDLSLQDAVLELKNLTPAQVAELMRRYASAVVRFMKIIFAELKGESGDNYQKWLERVSEYANIKPFQEAARELVKRKIAEVGMPFLDVLLQSL